MKIVFISNFHNHHQMPVCDAFLASEGVDFTFIATERVPEERIKFGYKHEFSSLPYFKEAITEEEKRAAEEECFDSDVVIIGSAPIRFIKRRLKARKLTFLYSERWFKNGFLKHPGDVYRAFKNFTLNNNKNFYLLCASGFAGHDSALVGAFPNRKLKWGYFPEFLEYSAIEELVCKKEPNTILWVGRMIDWKHPEYAISIAEKLFCEGIPFTMNIVGSGEMMEELKQAVKEHELCGCVNILGSMSPEEVRGMMEKSQILISTSDKQEGWGAVLNEGMNSGCAVVASNAIGSAKYLIKHGENGLLCRSENVDDFYCKVKSLLLTDGEARRLGTSAYYTVREEWTPDIAVERLVNFCRAKLKGEGFTAYNSGPISFDGR